MSKLIKLIIQIREKDVRKERLNLRLLSQKEVDEIIIITLNVWILYIAYCFK